MQSLDELGIKYGTDKASNSHNYLHFYEQTMPKKPARILEIGCFQGASARMWREYFPPETEVHILDLFEEYPIPDIPGVIFHKGDATHPYVLSEMRNFNFDVIIDDGSHNSRDMMITFFGLAHAGCSYYIEDLHTCKEEFYQQGLPHLFTADNFFKYLDHGYFWERDNNIILIKC